MAKETKSAPPVFTGGVMSKIMGAKPMKKKGSKSGKKGC